MLSQLAESPLGSVEDIILCLASLKSVALDVILRRRLKSVGKEHAVGRAIGFTGGETSYSVISSITLATAAIASSSVLQAFSRGIALLAASSFSS